MSHPNTAAANVDRLEEGTVRALWQAAVGKVFKIISKRYGVRNVTYTQVKAVKDTDAKGSFEIEVQCVEIIARVLDGKRTHSNICKEGVLSQGADSELLPDSFGEECPRAEFEKVTGAIMAYTNTYLDWVMQEAPGEEATPDLSVDLPHLKLTDMEASLVRNSPFLVKDLYILTRNSIKAALASIQLEMRRASRNMHLVDAPDPVYVAQKTEAAESLRTKLGTAQREATGARKDTALLSLQLDSLQLALLGKPSATTISWVAANPSEEGVVACVGLTCAPLDFVRWAQVSGRMVPAENAAGKELKSFFGGMNKSYTGPDKDGIYPLLRPATE